MGKGGHKVFKRHVSLIDFFWMHDHHDRSDMSTTIWQVHHYDLIIPFCNMCQVGTYPLLLSPAIGRWQTLR